MADAELIELGKREVDRLGLANYADIDDGCVVRVPKSYPVYDSDYREHLETVRTFVDGLENLQSVGRNGLHRYNNQDHAMLTGMLAVRNLILGEQNDLWSVNVDEEYHEEIRGKPEPLADDIAEVLQDTLARAFPKLDQVALGLSLGVAAAAVLWLATLILVLKGGDVVGPNLGLLSQYFPGYSVTASGSVLGLLYGFIVAFTGGWLFAFLRNTVVFRYIATAQRRADRQLLRRFLGNV
jgi:hypothetical protein